MSKQKLHDLLCEIESKRNEALQAQKKGKENRSTIDTYYNMGKEDALEYAINKLEQYLESN